MQDYFEFHKDYFNSSIFNETLQIEDTDLVKNFWKKDTFYLKTQGDVDKLLTVISNVDVNYDEVKRYFTVKVNAWPYPKTTCLLTKKIDPSKWIYKNSLGELLFHYNQTLLKITLAKDL